MMLTRPPGFPIIGAGGEALTLTGSCTATWSPKLSRTILSDSVGSFHSSRKAIQPPLWTARTTSSFTAGSGLCGSAMTWGCIATLTGRPCFQ